MGAVFFVYFFFLFLRLVDRGVAAKLIKKRSRFERSQSNSGICTYIYIQQPLLKREGKAFEVNYEKIIISSCLDWITRKFERYFYY